MITQFFGYTILITIFWFILYWIFGGVFFYAITLLRVEKLRKAQFSCLFTFASLLAGFGAARMGLILGQSSIRACIEPGQDVFGRLASIIVCGILELVATGLLWFIILIIIGFIILLLSRSENQSWIDSNKPLEDEMDELLEL